MSGPCFCCGSPANGEASTNERVWFDWCGEMHCADNIEILKGPDYSPPNLAAVLWPEREK